MKIQDQVCTQEQGKRLISLGINKFGLFVHYTNKVLPMDFGIKPKEQTASWAAIGEIKNGGAIDYYPAFTVAELGVMLPTLGIKRCKSNNGRGSDYYWLEYESQDWSDLNEAQLLAKFIIYLLENKLATAEEINKRLKD